MQLDHANFLTHNCKEQKTLSYYNIETYDSFKPSLLDKKEEDQNKS